MLISDIHIRIYLFFYDMVLVSYTFPRYTNCVLNLKKLLLVQLVIASGKKRSLLNLRPKV